MDFLYDVSHRCYLGRKNILCPQSNVAAAENEDDKIQGTYGDNLKWSFKDGVFMFQEPENTGYFSRKLQKQGNEFYADRVKEIVVEEGIDQIAKSAFEGCSWTKKVTLPEGIKVIGDEAFSTVYRLTEIKPSRWIRNDRRQSILL